MDMYTGQQYCARRHLPGLAVPVGVFPLHPVVGTDPDVVDGAGGQAFNVVHQTAADLQRFLKGVPEKVTTFQSIYMYSNVL